MQPYTLLGPVWTKLSNTVHTVHNLTAVCNPFYKIPGLSSFIYNFRSCKWRDEWLVHLCKDFEVRYCRHLRRLHRQYSFSKLWIVCTFNASSRSVETMEMAVHTLCFTQLNYSTVQAKIWQVNIFLTKQDSIKNFKTFLNIEQGSTRLQFQ